MKPSTIKLNSVSCKILTLDFVMYSRERKQPGYAERCFSRYQVGFLFLK